MTEFLKLQEVCEILRISKRTVYDLCRKGQLAGAVKVGRQWRVERTAFEEWVRKGRAATPEAPERPEECV